ncbi:bifunctional methylenetetrahydrofolate dehydrogenase/methenyltetrahydrofolate cyclohydrolase FolD [Campylobacter corcagiensis]|uniref:Bifunctional protein FolD n=1 Tax=Campylobacter corcagiensis TaxID=1448857 RepID=A0A7M1LE95_9BACT|nr:bifunctional methylenetetrahydrofolate dehydrogenase/methenyltetrahydrofolate cyclohydrolase FolD [Campylobacter corcagiensis]QKF64945.1 bifunctional 5,10-methylene-tetrahydrofolate dehydrogenase / 5,10-methylene-tetrahydrofolate cyclohydrolase [Campylobacter corcagiensis]QOQ86897.1 bifunctional methylenetetrahydrofolate dehydrogenase/methenyltetrahydrofolate cyclohydrolase FolD [Campylobacter corcagiensis]
MNLIDGKAISAKVKAEVKDKAVELAKKGVQPGLAVVLVGDDKASATYVASKEKACKACEIYSLAYKLPASTKEDELLNLIDELNNNDKIHGILVQLPLPKHIDTDKILEKIDPKKDVDGFSAVNVGRLVSGLEGFVPCTPLGVMRLLKEYGIDTKGKNAVVIGRSNIVGKPMANLLLNEDATVTITHSKTQNLDDITKKADIIVVAIGKPNFLTSQMVKEGAVVIDVGINRLDSGKLVGDADFEGLKDKCKFITPVPGGVGPMTIAMLLQNTVTSAQNHIERQK